MTKKGTRTVFFFKLHLFIITVWETVAPPNFISLYRFIDDNIMTKYYFSFFFLFFSECFLLFYQFIVLIIFFQAINEYTDAEKAVDSNLVRIRASASSCALARKSPITISAKKSPLSSEASSPTRKQLSAAGDSDWVSF